MVEDVLRMVEVRLDSPAGSPALEGEEHLGGLDAESGEISMQGGDMDGHRKRRGYPCIRLIV